MDLWNRHVLVAGTGVSGIGAVRLLSEAKADIVLYDGKADLDREAVLAKLPAGASVNLVVGEVTDALLQWTELVITSPGIPVDGPLLTLFREAGIPVWGEIELAWQFEQGKVYAITGTNGKTTTTSLVGQIFSAWNPETFVVGNIGNSYTGEVLHTTADSCTIAEISSFQLETIDTFAPVGTAILNITPDHLDRHYTMDNYEQVKESITRNQGASGFCVLNYDDERLRRFGENLPGHFFFSSTQILEEGIYIQDGSIWYARNQAPVKVLELKELFVFGKHNYENVMAAIALAAGAGIPFDVIRKVACEFRGVEHRIEYVTEISGVVYYNDSKGTNPDSSIKALQSMSRPTVLIAGGYDKKSDFAEFIQAFGTKVKALVLLGATADQLERQALEAGFTNIYRVDSLLEAVERCHGLAESGDAVLLSPACASWGMFRNFEERGDLFKKYVMELQR